MAGSGDDRANRGAANTLALLPLILTIPFRSIARRAGALAAALKKYPKAAPVKLGRAIQDRDHLWCGAGAYTVSAGS